MNREQESWLDRLTMRLGLWLIGGRETPREKGCAYDYGSLLVRYNNTLDERDFAIEQCGKRYAEANRYKKRLAKLKAQVKPKAKKK